MFSEPIEYKGLKRHHRSRTLVHGLRTKQNADSAVVDEAFAELPLGMSDHAQVDAAAPNLNASKNSSDRLLCHIAAEVAALNQRCAHLSDMLCRLDASKDTSR
jgi:hypothetical protein